MNDIKAEVIFDKGNEFIEYIMNALSKHLNYMDFEINIIIDDSTTKITYGTIKYIEDINGLCFGYIILNVLDETEYKTVKFPFSLDELDKNMMFINDVLVHNDKVNHTQYSIKVYEILYNSKKCNNMCLDELHKLEDIQKIVNDNVTSKRSNTFSVYIYFSDYIYQIIIDISCVTLDNTCLIRFAIEDTDSYQLQTTSFCCTYLLDDIKINSVIEQFKLTILKYQELIKHDIEKMEIKHWRMSYE